MTDAASVTEIAIPSPAEGVKKEKSAIAASVMTPETENRTKPDASIKVDQEVEVKSREIRTLVTEEAQVVSVTEEAQVVTVTTAQTSPESEVLIPTKCQKDQYCPAL